MSERRPLSLNQRHNRLLQHLSASRPRDPPPPSSSSEEMKTVKVKIEGRRRLCKASYVEPKDENAPEFSGFSDFDSPASIDKESEVKLNDVSEAKESEFCDAEDGSDDPVVEEDADIEEPRFSILSDLDSTPVKSKADGNEEEAIRDILNELSAKMDLLSMERPKMPNKVTPVGYSLDAAGTGAGKQEENSHLLENDGPSPPFHNAFSVNQSIAVKLPTELDVAGTEVGRASNHPQST